MVDMNIRLPKDLYDKLDGYCQGSNITPNVIFISAIIEYMARRGTDKERTPLCVYECSKQQKVLR